MTKSIGRVTSDLTISADGYSAGLNQTEERPFGEDGGDGSGAKLHAWMFDIPDENRAEVDQIIAAKAFIMGRNMFGPVREGWDRQGTARGATIRRSTLRSSCSPTTSASRRRWTAAPRTTSSPTESIRRWHRRARLPATAMSLSMVVARPPSTSTSPPPDRRATAADCATHARRRNPAVRGCPAAEVRASEVARRDLGYACRLSRAVLSRRTIHRF